MISQTIQVVSAGPGFIAPLQATPSIHQSPDGHVMSGVPAFGALVSDGLRHVNEQLLASQTDLQKLATGDVQNLHQIMIRLEESRVSFQLAMQVRNRLLEAYQDIMKMQI